MSEFASRYFVNVSEKEFFLKFNHKCVDFLDFKNLIFLGHKMLLSFVPQFLGVFLCTVCNCTYNALYVLEIRPLAWLLLSNTVYCMCISENKELG